MIIHETATHAYKPNQPPSSAFQPRPATATAAFAARRSGNLGTRHTLNDFAIGHGSGLGGDPYPRSAAVPYPPSAPVINKEAAPAKTGFSWKHMQSSPADVLWWFNGETPAGFYTEAMLHASGYGDPSQLSWRVIQGADKVAFVGPPSGVDVVVESKKGSDQAGDILIEVREGMAVDSPSYLGTLTVRQPRSLNPILPEQDHAGCPPTPRCPNDCPAHWTEIKYEIVNNLGEIVTNATINEKFPGPKTNDVENDWIIPSAISKPYFKNENGTFTDLWAYWCGKPLPVSPTHPTAYIGIDQIPHEFYVGSDKPGMGVRVQKHIAHRYLGYTRHESITSPAP